MLTIERQYLHMVDVDQLTCKFVEPNWKILIKQKYACFLPIGIFSVCSVLLNFNFNLM